MIKLNSTTGIWIACIAGVSLCWFGTDYANRQLAEIKPHELKQFESRPYVAKQMTFLQGWAKGEGVAFQHDPTSADLDDVFKGAADKSPEPGATEVPSRPIEPKYTDLVRQRASVDAVLDNGAIINGRFTKVGRPIDQLAIASPAGQPVIPVLESVSPRSVKVAVAGQSIELGVIGVGGAK